MKRFLGLINTAIISIAVLTLVACSSGDSDSSTTPSTGGGGSGGGGDTTVTLNSSVSGTVSSTASTSNVAYFPALKQYADLISPQNAITGTCETSSFNVYNVGGDGTVISSGTASGGSFDASVDVNDEVVIQFACGLKCFGKPGSTDLVCDPISNAVVKALETSLGAPVESSSLYKGLSVAKIAEGIVETLKLMSNLDPSNSFVDKLADATSDSYMAEIIKASPVGTVFDSMATLATEKKTENQAIKDGQTADAAKTTAAASSWTVAKVVEMMTGLGLNIETEVDTDMGLYSDLFGEIDGWVNTDFVANFRTYIGTLYNSLYVDKETQNVSLLCVARQEGNGDSKAIAYPPYNRGTAGAPIVSCIDTATSNNETDAMGITTANGTSMAQTFNGDSTNDTYRVALIVKPSYSEVNRNDPKGEHQAENGGGYDDFTISFIDVFPEFEESLKSGGVCSAYATDTPYGPDITDPEGFMQCVQDNNLGKYFAGMLGIYQFMRNSTLRSTRFSLEDLHNALVGQGYMGMQLSGDFWQAGVNAKWLPVTVTDQNNESTWMSAWQLEDTGTVDSDGRAILDLVCPAPLCTSGVPNNSASMTSADLQSFMQTYAPSYNVTMKMFERIPTMSEIRRSIFKESHHEPYNIAGPKTFHVRGNSSGSDEWQADAPILCKINNPNAAGDFVAGTSSITCGAATNVTWDAAGKPSNTTTYRGFYALQERGSVGGTGGNDVYFGLININNGMDYRLNGREFRVRGIKSDFTPSDNPNANGSQLYSVNDEFCDTWQDSEGRMQTQCWHEKFDYVAVSLDAGLYPASFFNPYTWNIPMTSTYWDGDTNSFQQFDWDMSIAVSNNNTTDNWDDDWAVCVNKNAVVVDTTNDVNRVLSITTPLDASNDLVDCFTTTESQFYYLMPDWGAQNRADVKYLLVRNDGNWTWADGTSDTNKVSMDEIETALGTANILGPASAETWLNGFEIANLGHDPKFDPYCDDINNDGVCGSDTDGDGMITLADDMTEPTISEPPFWYGDPDADKVKTLIDQCGGLTSDTTTDLSQCVNDLYNNDSIDITQIGGTDWNKLFECTDSSYNMGWVDIWGILNGPDSINVGGGCNTAGSMGPVRLRKLLKRNNAYNVERPNTMLKLISNATATSGTGVNIAKTAEIFSFNEAMALLFLRFNMPLNPVVQSGGPTVDNFPIYFQRVYIPGNHGRPTTGLLRAFLEAGGQLTPYTP